MSITTLWVRLLFREPFSSADQLHKGPLEKGHYNIIMRTLATVILRRHAHNDTHTRTSIAIECLSDVPLLHQVCDARVTKGQLILILVIRRVTLGIETAGLCTTNVPI